MGNKKVNTREDVTAALGVFLRRKRMEKGLTQQSLGEAIGYAQAAAKQTISQIERGAHWIPVNKLEEIIRSLGLDEDLFRQLHGLFQTGRLDESMELIHSMEQKDELSRTNILQTRMLEASGQPLQPTGLLEEQLTRKLNTLQTLFNSGLISEDDYQESKASLLRKFVSGD